MLLRGEQALIATGCRWGPPTGPGPAQALSTTVALSLPRKAPSVLIYSCSEKSWRGLFKRALEDQSVPLAASYAQPTIEIVGSRPGCRSPSLQARRFRC